jgi:DNA polymerase III subunit delta'
MNWLPVYQQPLHQQWQQSKLPHAIIFSGANGSGKQALATWLVGLLACQQPLVDQHAAIAKACGTCKACLLLTNQSHPDHQLLATEGNSIGVDDVRAVSRFFEKTAQLGQVRTLILVQAEKMTVAAANALLKTLEEPSANCFMLLLTDDASLLLPTINSRCRLIELRPQRHRLAQQTLSQTGSMVGEQLSDSAGFIELQQTLMLFLTAGQGMMILAEQLNTQSEAFAWLESIFAQWHKQKYQWLPIPSAMAPFLAEMSAETLWHCYQQIISTTKQIKQYNQTNREMVIEQLLAQLAQIIRANAKAIGCH